MFFGEIIVPKQSIVPLVSHLPIHQLRCAAEDGGITFPFSFPGDWVPLGLASDLSLSAHAVKLSLAGPGCQVVYLFPYQDAKSWIHGGSGLNGSSYKLAISQTGDSCRQGCPAVEDGHQLFPSSVFQFYTFYPQFF